MVSLVIFERSLFNYLPTWQFCIHNILTSHSLVSRVFFLANVTGLFTHPRIWALLSRFSWRRAAQPPRAFA